MKHELWLEWGFLQERDYQDMCWYNEGRASEIFKFIKYLFQNIKRRNLYFVMRYGKTKIYLKGNSGYNAKIGYDSKNSK